jgi:hypothetical protein
VAVLMRYPTLGIPLVNAQDYESPLRSVTRFCGQQVCFELGTRLLVYEVSNLFSNDNRAEAPKEVHMAQSICRY